MLCGAAWCAAVMCCISPRGAAWSYMMLRGNGMRRDMKGDGDGWNLRCCTRRRRPTRCQFLLCLFTWESPFGGVCNSYAI